MLLDIKEFCKPHTVPDFQDTLPDVWLEHEEQKHGRLLKRSGNFSGNSEESGEEELGKCKGIQMEGVL